MNKYTIKRGNCFAQEYLFVKRLLSFANISGTGIYKLDEWIVSLRIRNSIGYNSEKTGMIICYM